MSILIIDDSSKARVLQDALELRGYSVQSVNNLADAEYYTCWSEAIDKYGPYDFLFLDLTMDRSDLPKELHEEAKNSFSGWVFYEKVLKDKNPALYNRTIFYTAFGDEFKNKIGEERFNTLHVLPKTTHNMVQLAVKTMNKIIRSN